MYLTTFQDTARPTAVKLIFRSLHAILIARSVNGSTAVFACSTAPFCGLPRLLLGCWRFVLQPAMVSVRYQSGVMAFLHHSICPLWLPVRHTTLLALLGVRLGVRLRHGILVLFCILAGRLPLLLRLDDKCGSLSLSAGGS